LCKHTLSLLQEIQVDFEGRNPTDGDFDGIKQLLKQLLLKAQVNISELANVVISQDYIGSVMKQSWDEEMVQDDDDDEDENVVFGITTAINLTSRRETKCIQELKAMLLERASKNGTDELVKLIKNVLTNDSITTGFVLNERYINIPVQISVPMLEGLCKEVKRAVEKNKPYNFSYYIMILKFHRKEADKGKPQEDFYSNQEEELFLKESLASFEYSVKSEADSGLDGKWKEEDEELTPFRKVVIIDGKKFPQIVESINSYINGAN
jgi:protein BCP1